MAEIVRGRHKSNGFGLNLNGIFCSHPCIIAYNISESEKYKHIHTDCYMDASILSYIICHRLDIIHLATSVLLARFTGDLRYSSFIKNVSLKECFPTPSFTFSAPFSAPWSQRLCVNHGPPSGNRQQRIPGITQRVPAVFLRKNHLQSFTSFFVSLEWELCLKPLAQSWDFLRNEPKNTAFSSILPLFLWCEYLYHMII